jgi:hypothetical protein
MRVLLDVSPTYQRVVAVGTTLLLTAACGDKHLDKPLPKAEGKVAKPDEVIAAVRQQAADSGASTGL